MDPTSKNVSPTDFGKATFGDMDTPLEVVCNTIYKSPELLLGTYSTRIIIGYD
jgi:hypothetical protein